MQSGTLTATVGIFLFHPTIPNYPKAKFPGVVVFSEIYQGKEVFRPTVSTLKKDS